MRALLVAALLASTVAAAEEDGPETVDASLFVPENDHRPARLILGTLGGALGGAVGGFSFGAIGLIATFNCPGMCPLYGTLGGVILGASIGIFSLSYRLSVGLDGKGSGWATAAGIGAGLLGSLLIGVAGSAWLDRLDPAARGLPTTGLVALALAAPVLGATIGFDLSDQAARYAQPLARIRMGPGSLQIVFG